jgi:deoxyadenosine/deoxycytidine kinase
VQRQFVVEQGVAMQTILRPVIFIGITGILGSGKTTLGKLLAEKLGFEFVEEEFEENPHLAAFHSGDTDFLACHTWFFERDKDRYLKALQLLASDVRGVVIDKPFFENRAYNLVAPLTDQQRSFFNAAIDSLLRLLTLPDVLIDLEASTSLIMQRAANRDRTHEQAMPFDYVESLQQARTIVKPKRPDIRTLSFSADDYDFVNNSPFVDSLIEMIFRQS